MKLIFHCFLLTTLAVINVANLESYAEDLLQYLNSYKNDTDNNEVPHIVEDYDTAKQKDKNDKWAKKYNFDTPIKQKAKKARADDTIIKYDEEKKSVENIPTKYFLMDPILNSLRRQPESSKLHRYNYSRVNVRRRAAQENDSEDSKTISSSQESSSREMKKWKDEINEIWHKKRHQAMNRTRLGDRVNMIAARPWGVPCGDPGQHDMPWGNCMLAIECEPEYRIYRGDVFCGRTQFVCCGLQLNTYDNYQAFDLSFEDKSLSTDSNEFKHGKKTSKEKEKLRERAKRKRRRVRERRKKKIRKHIKKIIREITKILNKQYKNGTKQRKRRTRQLKKFIKHLKKQYKKDRNAVLDVHEHDLIVIDANLMNRLNDIVRLNKNFMDNATFREMITTGTMTLRSARMLLEAYPELEDAMSRRRRAGWVRRRASEVRRRASEVRRRAIIERRHRARRERYLRKRVTPQDFDVEYGYLYY